MKKSIKIIFALCALAITGVITLQLFWLKNYISVNKERFAEETRLSFEKAVKREFTQRGNTVQELFYHYLMDTSQVLINSKKDKTTDKYTYVISDTKDAKDYFAFSSKQVNEPIGSQLDPVKKKVAEEYARIYRTGEFEKISLIYNRTESINKYLGALNQTHVFNIDSFSQIFRNTLAQSGIHEPFIFYLGDEEHLLEPGQLPDSLLTVYPYITQPQPTYRNQKDYNYIIALFKSPVSYLKTKLTWLIASSVLLIIIVGLSLFYLIKIIYEEKRLSVIKNDFISNITHEFKTPIAAASAAIEAMEKFNVLENPERTKKYLAASKNELNRLLDLVNKILGISLYEKRQMELKKENIQIAEMIDQMIYNFSLIKNKHVQIDMRNNCKSPVVKADKVHLYNSISNIIDNALKYGGAEVKIIIQINCTAHELLIEISDNGPGIAAQNLPHIFNKFYRVPTPDERTVKGFGLGLYYTQSIIREHGGWCKAESEPGKGTTFKIGLPK
ncbi:MAG: HAMP domain-containing histidine kinase [Dinghuibacter sp.]|nr:HAMP domain-containing histidine kinase [Dinghuibacter sp.]